MYHCATMPRLLFILAGVVQVALGIPLVEYENEFSNDVDFAFENLDQPYLNVETPVSIYVRAKLILIVHIVADWDSIHNFLTGNR